jgi:hypothetical protein
MSAPAPEALKMQRPLPHDALRIVARGAKLDVVPSGLIKPLRVHLDANCVQNYHSDCAGRPI